MKLSNYIQEHHESISAFAKSQGVKQSQVHRWLNRNCEWHQDGVWCLITKQVKSNAKLHTASNKD